MKALKIVSYLLRTGHFPLGRRIDQGTEEVGDSRSLDMKVGGESGLDQDTVRLLSISEPYFITEIQKLILLTHTGETLHTEITVTER